jgi:hypothetical protein
VPSALITVVGFGQVSALSTRLEAALREKTVGLLGDTHQGGGQHPVSMTFRATTLVCRVDGTGQVGNQVCDHTATSPDGTELGRRAGTLLGKQGEPEHCRNEPTR